MAFSPASHLRAEGCVPTFRDLLAPGKDAPEQGDSIGARAEGLLAILDSSRPQGSRLRQPESDLQIKIEKDSSTQAAILREKEASLSFSICRMLPWVP